jgi:putative membrane protein
MHAGSDHRHEGHTHDAGRPRVGPASRRLGRAAIFGGMAGYLVWLMASGNLGNYINTRFFWLAWLGIGLFGLLALAMLTDLFGTRHEEESVEPATHTHVPTSWLSLALAACPLLLGFAVPSQPLGAGAVTGEMRLETSDVAVIPASSSAEWTILDWLRAYSSPSADRFNGRSADLVGFVYRREGDPPGAFRLTRFVMVHCAADAYAVGVPVRWAGGEQLPQDSWVRVKGPIAAADFQGQRLPVVQAAEVSMVPRPSPAYLY